MRHPTCISSFSLASCDGRGGGEPRGLTLRAFTTLAPLRFSLNAAFAQSHLAALMPAVPLDELLLVKVEQDRVVMPCWRNRTRRPATVSSGPDEPVQLADAPGQGIAQYTARDLTLEAQGPVPPASHVGARALRQLLFWYRLW